LSSRPLMGILPGSSGPGSLLRTAALRAGTTD